MKTKLIALLTIITLTSCTSQMDARQKVVEEMKTTDVYPLPRSTHIFVARQDDMSVWFVMVGETDGEIYSKTQIFGPYKELIEKQ